MKKVLTKATLVQALITQNPLLGKAIIVKLVETFFREISENLVKGQNIKLAGLGNFNRREKKERPGRNPKTGKVALIRARTVVLYHPSQKIKNVLKDYKNPLQKEKKATEKEINFSLSLQAEKVKSGEK